MARLILDGNDFYRALIINCHDDLLRRSLIANSRGQYFPPEFNSSNLNRQFPTTIFLPRTLIANSGWQCSPPDPDRNRESEDILNRMREII